jgi:hypothetical protein
VSVYTEICSHNTLATSFLLNLKASLTPKKHFFSTCPVHASFRNFQNLSYCLESTKDTKTEMDFYKPTSKQTKSNDLYYVPKNKYFII